MSLDVDEQVLEDLGDITLEEYEEYVQDFIDAMNDDIIKLEDAFGRNDLDIIKEIVHSIKGETANLRLNGICNNAIDIKTCIDNNNGRDKLEMLIKDLKLKVDDLKKKMV